MGRVFRRKQFSDYLGENRAILDIYTNYIPEYVCDYATYFISGTVYSDMQIMTVSGATFTGVYVDTNVSTNFLESSAYTINQDYNGYYYQGYKGIDKLSGNFMRYIVFDVATNTWININLGPVPPTFYIIDPVYSATTGISGISPYGTNSAPQESIVIGYDVYPPEYDWSALREFIYNRPCIPHPVTPTPTPTVTVTPTPTVTITPSVTPTLTPTPSPSPVSFDTDYQAILTYASSQGYVLPSDIQQTYQNQLVIDLKNAGIWTDLDILYIFATDGDEDYAKLNWKNPGVYTIIENGAVDFFTNIGFKTNTTNVANYFDTQYSTLTNKTGYTLTDAARFTWDYDGTGTGVYDGALGGPRESFNGGNNAEHRIQQDANNLPASFDNTGTGLKIIQRTSASNVNMYNNTSTPTSFTRNNTSLIAGNQVLFKRGDNVAPGSYRLSLYGLGASMSGKETDLYNSINTYMTSI